MPYEKIDDVPIWYEEHGAPDAPPVVALHGGVLTFETSVFNQNGEVVLAYIDKLMIKRRPAA